MTSGRPIMRGSRFCAAAALTLSAVLLAVPSAGRGAEPAPSGYSAAPEFDFERARIEYQEEKDRVARVRRLATEGIVSAQAVREEETRLRLAEVKYRESYMAVSFATPTVIIRKAEEYEAKNGQRRVRLTLVYSPTVGSVASDLPGLPDPSDVMLVPSLRNVLVSLRTSPAQRDGGASGQTIISVPYEARIPVMHPEQAVNLDLGLLVPDVEDVIVAVSHAGRVEEKHILLVKNASGNVVTLRAAQVSLTADLGGEAAYDLELERFTRAEDTFQLRTSGIPPQVAQDLVEPSTGSHLSQVFFSEGTTIRHLQLRLKLPEQATDRLVIDHPLRFTIGVLGAHLDPPAGGSSGKAALGAPEGLLGQVDLEIIPRGVGRLEVEAPNLFQEIGPGEQAEIELRVKNAGSRAVHTIGTQIDVPERWRSESLPQELPNLPPGAEARVRIRIKPPSEVDIGDYEAQVRVAGLSGDRRIEADRKSLRVHVQRGTSPWLMGLLAALGVGLVAGVVFLGRRLSKR
jgi:hypothetical protein